MMKKVIPKTGSEDQERDYWATQDSTEYIDWARARRVTLPQLHPSARIISIRLPEALLDDLKMLANKRDVPYLSLLELFLAERIKQEFESRQTGE
jgi:predicted DNA binding CopG/RHH family protein